MLILQCDANKDAMGAALLQEDRPLAFASASFSDSQKKYSQIEKELLSVYYGCKKFEYLLSGPTFVVQTDHQPLLPLVKKPLSDISPRLQRLVMKLIAFDFKMQYKPGKYLIVADTLSRDTHPMDELPTPFLEDKIMVKMVCVNISDEKLVTLQKDDTREDPALVKLNRMQHWNEPAIRFVEDILVLCNKVNPAMEEETKIEHVIGGMKKEYSFALYLNSPKTTDELLFVCKKMDYFEKKYRERVEISRNLYNGPRNSRPQQESRIDEVLDTLQGSKYFSAIDLKSGYWQVEVEEKDKEKTAFTTAHGLYEFNVMPFGLCNAPATFERNMENMLEEEAKTIFYRLGLEQETYLNIKQKLSTIYISKKKTTLEELFTHQLEKPEKNNDYYHFMVVGALENSLQNKQIVEALTAGVTYDLKKIIYTRNPQTPEEWLDYANTIRPVTSARGQPTPQRGLDRWRPESTPSPGQGHYRPQYGQLAFRRPGSGRFAFRNYADNTLPKNLGKQLHRADINPDHKDVIPHQGKDQHNEDEKIKNLMYYLTDSALEWYADEIISNPAIKIWEVVKEKLIQKFGSYNANPIVSASHRRLKREESIENYFQDKIRLLNQTHLTKEEKIHLLTDGLPNDWKDLIVAAQPTDATKWFHIAASIEQNRASIQFKPKNKIHLATKNNDNRKNVCPFWCPICSKKGIKIKHWVTDCEDYDPNYKKDRPNQNTSVKQVCGAPELLNVSTLTNTPTQGAFKLINISVEVNGIPAQAFVDTGATVSIINWRLFKRTRLQLQPNSDIHISQADGVTRTCGSLQTKVRIDELIKPVTLHVMKNFKYPLLIGLDVASLFNLLIDVKDKTIYTKFDGLQNPILVNHLEEIREHELKELLEHNRNVFSQHAIDLGKVAIQHKIITKSEQPISLRPYRRPLKEYEEIAEQVKELLEHKLIRISDSPWAFPVVMVPKKDENKRMCIDYRRLNEITLDDRQPLPHIQDMFDRLHGSRFFSTLDVAWGYWQIEMDPQSIQKTAFVTNDGHYEFLVMPFGLKNAASTFQRIIQHILGKVKSIQDFPRPDTVKKVRQFMGLANYYRKFVKDFSKISFPLVRLTRKNQPFIWNEEVEESFAKLKMALSTKHVLAIYNPDYPSKVYTDASKYGIGAILTQIGPDNEEHVIAYYSKTLQPHQENYSAYEMECLAVIQATDHFHVYIENQPFEIITDHAALQWLFTMKKPKPKYFRWILSLSSKSCNIVHRSGKQQTHVDALSRLPVVNIATQELQEHQQNSDLSFLKNSHTHDGVVMIKQKGVSKAVVPNSLTKKILEEYHDSLSHPSITKTCKLITQCYWWKGITTDIKNYVRSCKSCQLVKVRHEPTLGEMITPTSNIKPLQMIGCDTIVLGTAAANTKHKFIQVFVDHATRYLWAYPTITNTAQAVTQCLDKIIKSVNSINTILTDNGKNFISKEFNKFLSLQGIKHTYTSPHHPQCNGICEKLNDTIMTKLRIAVLEKSRCKWSSLLPQVVKNYNSTPHDVTGFSPLFLMYGIGNVPEFADQTPITIEEARKKASLRTEQSRRPNVQRILFNLPDEKENYEQTKMALDKYFTPHKNVVTERFKFRQRVQKDDESIDNYLISLRELSKSCEFGNLEADMITDQIIEKCNNKKLKEKLLQQENLTLSKTIDIARMLEISRKEIRLLEPQNDQTLNRVQIKPKKHYDANNFNKGRFTNQGTPSFSGASKPKCYRCGLDTHSAQECGAKKMTCSYCNKLGHLFRACRSRPNQNNNRNHKIFNQTKVKTIQEENKTEVGESSDEYTYYTGAENKEKVQIDGSEINMIIDTGSDRTFISYNKMLELYGHKIMPKLHDTTRTFFAYGQDRPLPCYETLVQEHEHIFHGLRTIKGYSHKVTLKDNYRPIAQICRCIPYAMVEAVNQELDKMLENGISEEVHHGSEWVSNIIIVPKRDSEEIILCIDLREVNKAILRERHPIPTIDNMLHALKGAKVFAKLDAKKGFWQVDLDPQSRPLTTFITHRGCYRFCKVPFGLSSAPEAYQKGMDSILLDLKGVICYLDDVVVYAKDRQELEERLRKVLQRFDKVGIRLNRNKCKFAMGYLDILGHIVSSEGIKPDNRKIEAVLNFPIPKNIEMLRWNWDLKTNKAFQDLKELLTKEPCLAYYNLNSPTELITDASPIGLGAVLILTQQNGIKRLIAYASRSLTDTEKIYSQIEKETLGGVWAIEHFNTYIWGRKFVVKTDHKPLIYMLNPKNGAVLPPRIQRLSWRLQPYDFEINFIQEKQNIADIFSRQPLSNTSDETWLEDYVHKVLSITSEELQALSLKEIKDFDIENLIRNCPICVRNQPLINDQPLQIVPLPSKTWMKLGIDIVGPIGHHYVLTVIDYYSSYPEAMIIEDISSKTIIEKLMEIFASHGYPHEVVTYNGLQFVSTSMERFLKECGIRHIKASPYYSKSNGKIEIFHSFLKKQFNSSSEEGKDWKEDLSRILMSYRTTPNRSTGKTPAFILFSREIKTKLSSLVNVNTKNGKIIHRNAKHLKHVPTQETNQGISDLIPEESQENLSSDSTIIEHLNSSDVQIPDDNSSNQDKNTSLNRPSSSRTGSTFNPVVSDRLDAEALHQLPPEISTKRISQSEKCQYRLELTRVLKNTCKHLTRNPTVFSGNGKEDCGKWMKDYERIARSNCWDATMKLANAPFFLEGTAGQWYDNNEEGMDSWDMFKEMFSRTFDNSGVLLRRAKDNLQSRAQKSTESCESYIQDVLSLCRQVNPDMSQGEKVAHLMKGVVEDVYQVILIKEIDTVEAFVDWCRKVEACKQRRIGKPRFERLPNVASIEQPNSSSLEDLIRRIVREEIKSALHFKSIVPEVNSLKKIIHEEVERNQTPIAEQGPYYREQRRHFEGPAKPTPYYQQQSPTRLTTARRKTDEWRTVDNIPVCFQCGRPGHVARYCRERRGMVDRQPPGRYHPVQNGPRTIYNSDETPGRASYRSPSPYPGRGRSPAERRPSISPSRRSGRSPYPAKLSQNIVDVNIDDKTFPALVDSGASFLVISDHFRQQHKKTMFSDAGMTLKVADGKYIVSRGRSTLRLEINGLVQPFEFIVLPSCSHDIILGWDFLEASRAIIDCGSAEILLEKAELPEDSSSIFQTVAADDSFIIPAGSTKQINVISETILGVSDVVMEPSRILFLERDLMVPASIFAVQHGKGRIWITNIGTCDRTVHKGMCIGEIQVLEEGQLAVIGDASDTNRQEILGQENPPNIASMISPDLSMLERTRICSILGSFSGLFEFNKFSSNLKSTAKHKINTEDHPPIKRRPYRVSQVERQTIQNEVDKMLKGGIVQLSESPWSSPVVLVKKKNGSWRFCVDYRHLNKITKKDVYPLPRIDDKLDCLRGASYYSSMDLRSGYWQIEVDEADREKTAFITPDGLYELEVMPFGLCNAPATFERMMDTLLRGLKWSMCLCYLDDIIVFSPTFDEHFRRLELVLRCLSKAGLSGWRGRAPRPGKHQDADCLPRNPIEANNPGESGDDIPTLAALTDIVAEQRKDPVIVRISEECLKNDQNRFKIINGALYKRNFDPVGQPWLLVIPRHLRPDVLRSLHDNPTAGHLGLAKTHDRIRRKYFWPGLLRSIRKYVGHCRECQRRKHAPLRPPGLLQPIPPTSVLFQRVGIDLLGRFPISHLGNKWIIVCTDYLTRNAITRALPSADAQQVAKFVLEDVVLKHGAPREIITDRGRVFQSKLISELTGLCSSAQRFTTAYHPQTNGLTERLNKTLADMMSMYVDVEQKEWDVILPFITFAYNTAKQDTTGFTPFSLIHGREAETTLDTLFPLLKDEDQEDYNREIVTRQEETRQLARLHTLRAQEGNKRLFDAKHREVSYQPGDKVWIFIPVRKIGISEKLIKRYFGPYRVTRRISDVTYEVESLDTTNRRRKPKEIVHVVRMKNYRDPDEQLDLPEDEPA
ncbi:hypothetical protein LAZ67_9000200, partial [Cordylochernes scorpioides]